MSRLPPMELRELCQMLANGLAEIVDELGPELLPNGRRHGAYWRTGSVADERGESLALNLSGPNRGMWTDFAACQGVRGRSGDMLGLVAEVLFGGRIGDAIAWAKSRLGYDDLDPARLRVERGRLAEKRKAAEADAAASVEKMRRIAMGIWIQAQPLDGSPAELYLATRSIDLSLLHAYPGSLRFHPDCFNTEAQRGFPALVGAVVNLEGEHVATHRIWIEPDGQGGARKHSGLAEPKMALGQFWGGHLPLNKGVDRCTLRDVKPGTHVAISEGIEDGLSIACACPDRRVVAAVTGGNIGAMRLPEQVPGVTIIGQRDLIAAATTRDIIDQVIAYRRDRPREKPKGMSAAMTLANAIAHLQEGGRTVRLALPPEGVKDANDLAQFSSSPEEDERKYSHARV